MITLAKDLAVNLQEDRPGMLARAAEAIASGGLNLDGFAEVEGILHMLTSDPKSARLALEAAGVPPAAEGGVVGGGGRAPGGRPAPGFRRLGRGGDNGGHPGMGAGNPPFNATEP